MSGFLKTGVTTKLAPNNMCCKAAASVTKPTPKIIPES